jgi:hypothetical protein
VESGSIHLKYPDPGQGRSKKAWGAGLVKKLAFLVAIGSLLPVSGAMAQARGAGGE